MKHRNGSVTTCSTYPAVKMECPADIPRTIISMLVLFTSVFSRMSVFSRICINTPCMSHPIYIFVGYKTYSWFHLSDMVILIFCRKLTFSWSSYCFRCPVLPRQCVLHPFSCWEDSSKTCNDHKYISFAMLKLEEGDSVRILTHGIRRYRKTLILEFILGPALSTTL